MTNEQPESAHSQRTLTARERESRALELRKGGATYQQIADKLGYRNESGARAAVKRRFDKLEKVSDETAEELRRIELERLDTLLLSIMPQARRGDVKAVHAAIRISESRRRLLGLDAPTQITHTLDDVMKQMEENELDAADVVREVEKMLFDG